MTTKPPPLPDRYLEPYEVVSRKSEETTQREGMTRDPRDLLISSLQQEVHTLRLIQQLPSEPPPPFDEAPDTRPSLLVLRKQRAARVTKLLGKWAALLALLPLVGGIVARKWPEYSGVVDIALQVLGLQ